MLLMKYIGETAEYNVEFERVNKGIVQVKGTLPAQTNGFILSRIGKKDKWDYSDYTTVYREQDGTIQFSNDGSVYVPPPEPEPVPDPEPYVPTLEEVQETKVWEMNAMQQEIIQQGIEVALSDGTVEQFTLTDHDQTSLMGLQTQVAQGVGQIPWHTSDQSEHCKYYSNMDMGIITARAMEFVTFQVTYFRDLRIYIRSLQTKEEVGTVYYGMLIPEEYQSDVLKDMYTAMLGQEG